MRGEKWRVWSKLTIVRWILSRHYSVCTNGTDTIITEDVVLQESPPFFFFSPHRSSYRAATCLTLNSLSCVFHRIASVTRWQTCVGKFASLQVRMSTHEIYAYDLLFDVEDAASIWSRFLRKSASLTKWRTSNLSLSLFTYNAIKIMIITIIKLNIILSGARQKIGYRCALKLLRCGASVIATTRFPVDASKRFLEEVDSSDWFSR